MSSPDVPLQRAIAACGSQTGLADAITRLGKRCTQQTVSWWLKRCDGLVPRDWAPYVEAAANGAVRCEELCPSERWVRQDHGVHYVVGPALAEERVA